MKTRNAQPSLPASADSAVSDLKAVVATEVPAPVLDEADTQRYEATVGPMRDQVAWNGGATRVVSLAVAGAVVNVRWYRTEYAHAAAFGKYPEGLPTGRAHHGLVALTHLRCRQGWVTTRRSGRVGLSGLWQPAAVEGVDIDDLCRGRSSDIGVDVDLAAVAARSLHEELGLSDARLTLSRAVIQPHRTRRRSHRLYLVVDAPWLDFADVCDAWRDAADGWESDRVECRTPPGNGPEMVSLWWPS
jgi:hypothetical protein